MRIAEDSFFYFDDIMLEYPTKFEAVYQNSNNKIGQLNSLIQDHGKQLEIKTHTHTREKDQVKIGRSLFLK